MNMRIIASRICWVLNLTDNRQLICLGIEGRDLAELETPFTEEEVCRYSEQMSN